MKVIGWTSFTNHEYPNMFDDKAAYILPSEYAAARIAVVNELREHQYKLTGTSHQTHKYGCPVLENGKKFNVSQRTWGAIMADAYPEDIPHYLLGDYRHITWAWRTGEIGLKEVLPNPEYKEHKNEKN